jgi:glycosyltransferase involved in cell wall biosynthesis
MRQRPQYLLAAFAAAGHPVFFVDPRESRVRSVNGVTVVPSVSEVPAAHVVLYVHFAPVRPSLGLFEDAVILYDILDDLSIYDADEVGMPASRRVRSHHPVVMAEADLVIASSPVLAERHRAERHDILILENGVDVERFGTPVPIPPELSTLRPCIGYHGAVAPWLDFDLIEAVARRNPGWWFVFVGPVDPKVRHRVARLEGLGNVVSLGERPSDAMPAYVQGFDVGAIWFKVDHLTEGVSPLKMFELLAAGKPVVATPLPACVAEPDVVTASTPEGWSVALAGALASGSVESRQAAAARASWDTRLAPLLARMDGAGLRRVPG